MAELLALVASVVQVTGAGLKLSQTLYQYADSVATADRRIKDIAKEIQLTSFVIQELGAIFKSNETSALISKNAVHTADATMKECSAVFAEIEATLKKNKKKALGKLLLPFRDSRIELLRNHIEKLKSTLQLLMQVLTHAQQIASHKLDRDAEAKQREQIKELLEIKKKSTEKYEQSLRTLSLSDDSTILNADSNANGDYSLTSKTTIEQPLDQKVVAMALGSTINNQTLETCVLHIRNLLGDIETLQRVINQQEHGKDHSKYHQNVVGTYFQAREHLDSVLLGNSKRNRKSVATFGHHLAHTSSLVSAEPLQMESLCGITSSGSRRSLTSRLDSSGGSFSFRSLDKEDPTRPVPTDGTSCRRRNRDERAQGWQAMKARENRTSEIADPANEGAKQIRFESQRAERRVIIAQQNKELDQKRAERLHSSHTEKDPIDVSGTHSRPSTAGAVENSGRSRKRHRPSMTQAQIEEQRRLLTADTMYMQRERGTDDASDQEERNALIRQQQQAPSYYNTPTVLTPCGISSGCAEMDCRGSPSLQSPARYNRAPVLNVTGNSPQTSDDQSYSQAPPQRHPRQHESLDPSIPGYFPPASFNSLTIEARRLSHSVHKSANAERSGEVASERTLKPMKLYSADENKPGSTQQDEFPKRPTRKASTYKRASLSTSDTATGEEKLVRDNQSTEETPSLYQLHTITPMCLLGGARRHASGIETFSLPPLNKIEGAPLDLRSGQKLSSEGSPISSELFSKESPRLSRSSVQSDWVSSAQSERQEKPSYRKVCGHNSVTDEVDALLREWTNVLR